MEWNVMYTCIYIYIYIYICICVSICMYVCIYIYIICMQDYDSLISKTAKSVKKDMDSDFSSYGHHMWDLGK